MKIFFKIYALIEDGVNSIILLVFDKLIKILKALTPSILIKLGNNLHKFYLVKKEKSQLALSTKVKSIATKAQHGVQTVRSLPLKEKITTIKSSIKDTLEEFKKIPEHERKKYILNHIRPIPLQLKNLLILFSQTKHFIPICICGFSFIISIAILKLRPHKRHVQRIFATARPVYYKLDQKYAKLKWFFLPTIDDPFGTNRTLRASFVFVGSNRFVVYYIREHIFEIRDYLNTVFEPITPQFLLTDEGKRIIKDRVEQAINRFLYEKKIEGFITKVYISEIMVD